MDSRCKSLVVQIGRVVMISKNYLKFFVKLMRESKVVQNKGENAQYDHRTFFPHKNVYI